MFALDAAMVFVGGMYVMHCLYPRISSVLNFRYGTKYAALRPYEKEYSHKNVIKAGTLAMMTPLVLKLLIDIIFRQQWDTPRLRLLGALYSATDVLALIKFKTSLPINTFMHHSCVTVFSVINLFIDYEQDSPWRHMVVLAGLSIPTYLVNLYLALRKIETGRRLRPLARRALAVYMPCVACNALYQCSVVWRYLGVAPVSTALFGTMATIVFLDDLKLMRHLQAAKEKKV